MNFSLPGQVRGGDIYGKIVGIDGNGIPGVLVTITGEKIGKLTTITSEKGNFRLLSLPPGEYDVKCELEGFKQVVLRDIELSLGSSRGLSIAMMSVKEVVSNSDPIPPKIIVLKNNHGINPYKKKVVHKKDSNFYYMQKKLYAKFGVAKVDSAEKDLNDITEFPYKPEDYHTGGLVIIPHGVYVIKLDKKGGKLLFIRVIEILNGRIKVEYHPSE
jgi:hypothetical protein